MTGAISDPHVLGPGLAPTPFTADEIRAGCPAGRMIRLRIEAEGEAPFHRVSRFVECDETGATLERSRLTPGGEYLAEPEVGRVIWRDLQAHASFPADATTIESERIDTAIGQLECLRYTVRDGATEEVRWFAMDLPGLPIQSLTTTDGRVTLSVTLVDNSYSGEGALTPGLFVYGTLAPGRSNAHILADVPGTWEPATVRGQLLPEGWGAALGFPALVIDDQGPEVSGLLFTSAVLAEHWDRLDEFEGEGYDRVLTTVTLEGGEVQAYLYALRGVNAPLD
jgi:gamma-glutamylcyclotransferase (GGCT)/AIG2-like uncharacterized protein YtfP